MLDIIISLTFALAPGFAPLDAPDFEREVRPILSDRCFPCHGPDTAGIKGELRLDTRERA
ncbi:MAG: c-type cytochrome domain-containing protein, partial [Planctomycetota bacterium]